MAKPEKITHLQMAKNKIQHLSALVSRLNLFNRMGKSYGDVRDIYTALGYPKVINFEDYAAKYFRQDLAKRVVNAPASESWRLKPTVTENETDETEFEKQFNILVKEKKIYQACTKIDILSGIGRYGILVLGLDDGRDLDKEVQKASQLLYIHPYSESSVSVKEWEKDTRNERYNLPLSYSIQTTVGDDEVTNNQIEEVIRDILQEELEE